MLCFIVWLALFLALDGFQNSIDPAQQIEAVADEGRKAAVVFAMPFGLVGLSSPGIPRAGLFAFGENTKLATEAVAQEFRRRYWEARGREPQHLATNPPSDEAVQDAAIADPKLEQFIVTDAKSAKAP